MNTDALTRATFVLDRATADRLTAISERMGVSRSALVRDVLAEPIELMHRWVLDLPAAATPADAAAALERISEDVGDWLDSKAAQLDLLRGSTDGNA